MPHAWTTLTEDQFDHRSATTPAGLRATVLSNGQLQTLTAPGPADQPGSENLINLLVASPLVGAATRLYLRALATDDDGSRRVTGWVALLGPDSTARVHQLHGGFRWSGRWEHLDYRVELLLHETETAWCWRVSLQRAASPESGAVEAAGQAAEYDVVLTQDVGLAARGQVQNNEAYTSQYVDHQIAPHPAFGPVAMARQNLPQHGSSHPWLAHGCLTGGVAALTDAYDFYGPAYRAGLAPQLIDQAAWPTRNRQGEFSCHTLLSAPVRFSDAESSPAEVRFVGHYLPDHSAASAEADAARLDVWKDDLDWLDRQAADPASPAAPFAAPPPAWLTAPPLNGQPLTGRDLDLHWPEPRHHEEFLDGDLASFFDERQRHVVLKNKELAVDRRHAHLLMAGRERLPGGNTLCSTGYASGPLASHICLGNTSFNKLLPVSRDPLNLVRGDGARLYIRAARTASAGEAWADLAEWRPLGTASGFAMEPDECNWVYRLGPDLKLIITATAEHDGPRLRFDVDVHGQPLDLLLVNHLALGDREHEVAGRVEVQDHRVTLRPGSSTLVRQKYPEVRWEMAFDQRTSRLGGTELLNPDAEASGADAEPTDAEARLPYLLALAEGVTGWGWTVAGSLGPVAEGEDRLTDRPAPERPEPAVSLTHDSQEAARMATAVPWFESNAAIHLTAPHGIEQYGGAAWGLRDVCQGPTEWLLARGETGTVARMLLDVFSHQYEDSGMWPQWTMHPPFQAIQSPHSHGDVAVWPIIATINYLRATDDLAFLDQAVPFTTPQPPFGLTERPATVRQHLNFAIQKLLESAVPGTALLAYGEGDWNDSLQPARPEMRRSMVSTWTVALFFQAVTGYAEVLRRVGDRPAAELMEANASAIRADFDHYLIADGETAGLYLHDPDPDAARWLLHPRDLETGVTHRLLPMIRGIISEVFTPAQALSHAKLIEQHLLAPDGAHLMNRPPDYHGGLMTHFQRLESASFFGREIGLMYVHAHLRYAEAMAKLGRAEALSKALLQVNPVGIAATVPNAAPRQANCYFSSSDAGFLNRRDSEQRYDDLMDGQVPVHGGWRVYSSGPGIYVGLVLRQWLGLRRHFDRYVFDPVLSQRYDGLRARLRLAETDCTVTFRVSGRQEGVTMVKLDGEVLRSVGREPNPYRQGGWCVRGETLWSRLKDSKGQIEIEC